MGESNDIDALMAEDLDSQSDALWEQSVIKVLGEKEFRLLYGKPKQLYPFKNKERGQDFMRRYGKDHCN